MNSVLQRARAKLKETGLAEEDLLEPDDPKCVDFLNRYIEAFERADVAAFTDLLTEDVLLEMPPFYNWFRGREYRLRFVARVFKLRGTDWKVHTIAANGQPGPPPPIDSPSRPPPPADRAVQTQVGPKSHALPGASGPTCLHLTSGIAPASAPTHFGG
ncbi:nuclear transport factor 2 family protein [Kribbella sp. NBC_00382]|uniref:nuclear transport factor 2 family protein n=1 Tax=Kribbella sp. NBC_00382 TaxID=2975967 RepID=UPI002E2517E4